MEYTLIKKALRDKGLTMQQVADAVSLTQAGLYKYMRLGTMPLNKLKMIADLLGMSLQDVVKMGEFEYSENSQTPFLDKKQTNVSNPVVTKTFVPYGNEKKSCQEQLVSLYERCLGYQDVSIECQKQSIHYQDEMIKLLKTKS